MSSDVDSVARADIDTKFQYAFADRLAIAKGTSLNLTHSPRNSRLRVLVSEAFKPCIEWGMTLVFSVNDQVEHTGSVA